MSARTLFRLELGAAVLLGILAAVTLVWRDWIEGVFGVDPDRHNGSVEWLVVAVLAVAACSLGALARRQWRQLPARA